MADVNHPTLYSHVIGVDEPYLANVEARLKITDQAYQQTDTKISVEQLFKQNAQEIQRALKPYGFFKVKIKKSLFYSDENWHAIYNVQLGPRLKICKVTLNISGPGSNLPAFNKIKNHFPLQEGQALDTQDYEQAKKLLFDTAAQEGFLTAELKTHTVNIDLSAYTASIKLEFETGPRFYFGQVTFSEVPLSQKFLQAFLPFHTGEKYNSAQLLELQDSLTSSTYFSKVLVQPKLQEEQNNLIPIDVILIPKKKHQYTFGAGYGTDTGARISMGWDWRYITRTGANLSTQLQLSQVQQALTAVYSIPGHNPAIETYNLNTTVFATQLPDESRSITEQIGVNYVRKMGHWKQVLGLNYQLESFKLEPNDWASANILLPSASWSYVRANNRIFASQGNRFNFRVQGAADWLLSDRNFAQIEASDKFIFPISSNNRGVVRANLGYSIVNNIDTLPVTLQYYTGGSLTVRGYNYQSLGPGRYLTVASAELQHRLTDKWYVLAFYDIGNAYNNIGDSLEKGVGIGVMWQSPIGPMELTLGKAISKTDQPNLIQFSMGPDL